MTDTSPTNAADAGILDLAGDLTVHRLGFGAMRITGDGIWGEPPDRDEAKAVLRRAVELGVNFIDTADSYGPEVSETLIAEALHPYPDDLVIATKGGLERTGPGRWPTNGRPEHLRAACEGSLQRLRLDQIPLYQFHRPDPDVPLEDSIGAIVELKDAGQGAPHRRLQRHRGPAPAGAADDADRVGAEPLQRHRPHIGVARRPVRAGRLAFLPWAPILDLDGTPVAGEIADHRGEPRQVVLAWLLARSPVCCRSPAPARSRTSRATWRPQM